MMEGGRGPLFSCMFLPALVFTIHGLGVSEGCSKQTRWSPVLGSSPKEVFVTFLAEKLVGCHSFKVQEPICSPFIFDGRCWLDIQSS